MPRAVEETGNRNSSFWLRSLSPLVGLQSAAAEVSQGTVKSYRQADGVDRTTSRSQDQRAPLQHRHQLNQGGGLLFLLGRSAELDDAAVPEASPGGTTKVSESLCLRSLLYCCLRHVVTDVRVHTTPGAADQGAGFTFPMV
jgi:hypothetical protein